MKKTSLCNEMQKLLNFDFFCTLNNDAAYNITASSFILQELEIDYVILM